MPSTIHTVLTVEVPPETAARARAVSPRIRVAGPGECKADPSILRDAEVAFVAGWLKLDSLCEARASAGSRLRTWASMSS